LVEDSTMHTDRKPAKFYRDLAYRYLEETGKAIDLGDAIRWAAGRGQLQLSSAAGLKYHVRRMDRALRTERVPVGNERTACPWFRNEITILPGNQR
jgi:hypothetical protein